MTKKYQVGMQDLVLEIIKQSKLNGLQYITKKQIVTEVKKQFPKTKNLNDKVGQALYHLQKKTKYRQPRIKKIYDETGKKKLGWSSVSEYGMYDIFHLPRSS